ncbi:ricin-type beta-trefoil lectin domain protein (plasmid) [Streptomyces atratus]|uniref:ricin-type beta-trefoil lectin domain protein n=1 Tax=Streptomyces atratus TaxID=1893 RepID=UPI002F917EE7
MASETPVSEQASEISGAVQEPEAAGVTEAAGVRGTVREGGETGASSSTAADVEEEAEETLGGMAEDAASAPPGRPHKSLLAGAAIVGALLIAVPFLVSGEREDERVASAGVMPGTLLGSSADEDTVGAVESAPPAKGGIPANSASPGKSSPAKSHAGKADAGAPGARTVHGGGEIPAGRATGSSGSRSGGSVPQRAKTQSPAKQSVGTSGSAERSTSAPGVSIRGHASGRCIDVTDGKGDGTPLQIWDCSGSSQQTWRFMGDGTVRSMGLCMDVAWGATSNGAVIQLATCNGGPAQRFRLNSSHDLVGLQAGKCVDVKERHASNGSRLQLWDCNGQGHQKWSAG